MKSRMTLHLSTSFVRVNRAFAGLVDGSVITFDSGRITREKFR
jgi:hypothetical protein